MSKSAPASSITTSGHGLAREVWEVLRHPGVALGVACYIALTVMAFQYPTFSPPEAPGATPELGYSLPGLANALAFVAIGALWGWRNQCAPAYLSRLGAGAAVAAGIVGHLAAGVLSGTASCGINLLCDSLIGAGLALMSVGWVGLLAAQSTLRVAVNMVAAALLSAALLLGAQGADIAGLSACYGLVLVAACALFLRDVRCPTVREDRIHVPWKLMATIFLQGLSVGLMHSVVIAGPWGLLPFEALSVALAALGAAAAILWLRLDFNHLMYMVGLPLMALGQLWMVLAYPTELGIALHEMGYRFVMILSWAIAAWTVRAKGVSSCWVWPCIMVSFTLGRFAGPFLEALPAPAFTVPPAVAVPVIVAFLVLLGAFALFDGASPHTGWGTVRPSEGTDVIPSTDYDQACDLVAADFGLSPREREMLGYLARGRNVEYVSERLSLSKETVRTHRRNLYRKIDVHSQQDLMSLLEATERKLRSRNAGYESLTVDSDGTDRQPWGGKGEG